jgi:hypothetical protein
MDDVRPTDNGSDANKKTTSDSPSALVVLKEKPPQETDTAKSKNDQEAAKADPHIDPRLPFFRAVLMWIRRDTTSTDWLIVLLTAVIAGTSYLQWHEIKSGGRDTHDLAVAAKAQADKMKDMSEAADKIRQAAEGMVAQEQRIADNAKIAVDAANGQSKSALDTTIAASRLDQRAWMGITQVIGKPEEDKVFDVTIELKNSGKTPANNVVIYNVYDPVPVGDGAHFGWETLVPNKFGTVPPNVERLFTIHPSKFAKLTKADMDTFNTRTMWVHGRITYDDIFGRHHWLTYCTSLTAGWVWAFCSEHNDTDDNGKNRN